MDRKNSRLSTRLRADFAEVAAKIIWMTGSLMPGYRLPARYDPSQERVPLPSSAQLAIVAANAAAADANRADLIVGYVTSRDRTDLRELVMGRLDASLALEPPIALFANGRPRDAQAIAADIQIALGRTPSRAGAPLFPDGMEGPRVELALRCGYTPATPAEATTLFGGADIVISGAVARMFASDFSATRDELLFLVRSGLVRGGEIDRGSLIAVAAEAIAGETLEQNGRRWNDVARILRKFGFSTELTEDDRMLIAGRLLALEDLQPAQRAAIKRRVDEIVVDWITKVERSDPQSALALAVGERFSSDFAKPLQPIVGDHLRRRVVVPLPSTLIDTTISAANRLDPRTGRGFFILDVANYFPAISGVSFGEALRHALDRRENELAPHIEDEGFFLFHVDPYSFERDERSILLARALAEIGASLDTLLAHCSAMENFARTGAGAEEAELLQRSHHTLRYFPNGSTPMAGFSRHILGGHYDGPAMTILTALDGPGGYLQPTAPEDRFDDSGPILELPALHTIAFNGYNRERFAVRRGLAVRAHPGVHPLTHESASTEHPRVVVTSRLDYADATGRPLFT